MKKLALLAALFAMVTTLSVYGQAYTWNQVRIGGSGNIPSFVAHPKVPDLYFVCTDVGTPYRWNKDLQKWEPIMLFNSVPVNYWNWEVNQRCGSIGVDPNDGTGNILYAVVSNSAGAGPGQGKIYPGTILKSIDRGNSWTDLHVNISVNPNKSQTYGDRILVDPRNSDVVWAVTDTTGAWRTDNAGSSWTQMSSVSMATEKLCSFILYDTSAGSVVVNSKTVSKRIYIGRPSGVWVSNDGGQNFSLMPNSPAGPTRAVIHADGTLYVSATVWDVKKGVYKYRSGSWQDISPITLNPTYSVDKRVYSKVAVSPLNSDNIIVSTSGTWNKDPYYISTNGGAPGSYNQGMISRDNSEAPHSASDGVAYYNCPGHNPNAFTWDPFYPNRVWINDMLDVLCTNNIFDPVANWKIRIIGLEEIVVTGPMVAPPSGKNVLMSVTADVGGAHHRSLTEPLYQGAVSYTAIASNIQQGLNSQSVAFQYTNPDFVVRVATDSWGSNLTSDSRAAYSTNGGDTYTRFPQSPGMRGRIAVSANSQNLVWLTQSDNGAVGNVYWSANLGSNWTKATGAPSGILPLGDQFMLPPGQNNLVADKANGNYFYIWDRGNFYVSSDLGHSFQQTTATGLAANNGSNPNGSGYATASNVETTPGKTGDVWIAFNGGGLFHTTDTGKTFTRVGDASLKPKWVAVALSDTTPSAHLVLYVTNETQPINGVVYGAFRSDDTARTWTTIADILPGIVQNVTADNRGRLMLGISGNGIFFGAPVGGPVQAVEITNAASDTIIAGFSVNLKVKLTPTYPTNPAVTWSSSDTTKAKVDVFGKVTGVSAGSVTITATSVDGGITDTHTIIVIPPVVSASVVLDSTVYGTLQTPKLIAASLLPANTTNKTLNWSVGNTAIAKVTSNGIVTGLQLGTTTLTVAAADGGATRTVPLIITTIVTATDAGSGSGTTTYGQFVPEGPSGTDKRWHAGYTWSTAMSATIAIDTSFVTNPAPLAVYRSMRVSKVNGTNLRYYMRDLIPGANYTVRLHFIENDNANKANHTFSVKANGSADSLVDFNIYQAAGNRLNTAFIHSMQVKANSAGVIEVYFFPKVGAGDPYMAYVSGVEVRINPLQGIAISSPNDTISVSFTDTLRLTTNPLNATNRNLVYASSNEAVATVSLTGVVSAKSAGTVTITATSVEGGFTSTKTYTVVYTPVTSVLLNTVNDTVFVGATKTLTATVLPAKASNKTLVWTSSDTTIAKVSNAGVVSGLKQGTAVITAASAETPSIKAQANVYVANVLPTAVALTPSPAIIGERDTLLMKSTFTPSNTSIRTLAWSSSDTTIASVDANGIILARKQGTATVTAVTTDGSAISVNLPVTIVPFDSCGGIKNPGFESDMLEWLRFLAGAPSNTAVYTVSGMGHSGDKAVSLGFTNDNTSMNLKGSVPVTGGSVIVLSQWVKVAGTSGQYPWWAGYGMGFVNNAGTPVQADVQKVLYNVAAYRDQWALIRDTLTVPDSATGFTYWVSKVGPGTVWLDDFCIQVLTSNNTAIYAINAGSEQNYTNLPPTPYDTISIAQFQPEGSPSPVNKWHGGYTWIIGNSNPVDVSGVDRPAPPDVYKYIRISKVNITPVRYYLRNLTPNTYYGIRLHFLETSNTDKLNRIFSVKATNGIDSLIDFVPYTAAGNVLNKVVIRTIRAKADANGLIVVYLYPKSGTYDPYSASLAALELCTLASQPAARSVQPIAVAADKPALEFKATVFPNPSSAGFTVQITAVSQAPVLLTVTDNAGRQVHVATVFAGKAYQFGQKLKAGVYHVQVQQGNEHSTLKLIKL